MNEWCRNRGGKKTSWEVSGFQFLGQNHVYDNGSYINRTSANLKLIRRTLYSGSDTVP